VWRQPDLCVELLHGRRDERIGPRQVHIGRWEAGPVEAQVEEPAQ
jgi:hypothetical protein